MRILRINHYSGIILNSPIFHLRPVAVSPLASRRSGQRTAARKKALFRWSPLRKDSSEAEFVWLNLK